jgi:Na+/glutamate symporter
MHSLPSLPPSQASLRAMLFVVHIAMRRVSFGSFCIDCVLTTGLMLYRMLGIYPLNCPLIVVLCVVAWWT